MIGSSGGRPTASFMLDLLVMGDRQWSLMILLYSHVLLYCNYYNQQHTNIFVSTVTTPHNIIVVVIPYACLLATMMF